MRPGSEKKVTSLLILLLLYCTVYEGREVQGKES
jgi:hypothetical protein